MNENLTLTALEGVRVGHHTDLDARTGCTAILLPSGGATTSGEVRGGAPGTRETALLEPAKRVEVAHGICLAGGSAFGLAAATGVMQFLEEIGEGVETRVARVPLVPAAVIYDLASGSSRVRPTAENGYRAAQAATNAAVGRGRIGAGTGAMVGKGLGLEHAEPGGVGNALLRVGEARVAAFVVANAFGDVVDDRGVVAKGTRVPNGSRLSGSRLTDKDWIEVLLDGSKFEYLREANTTLIVVGTDTRLSKTDCFVLSQAAQMGLARGTRPSHTSFDGDTAFAFATGQVAPPPLPALIAAVQRVTHLALLDAVRDA
jgi:L-aminopeptidase/D-esterase-like protein